MILIVRYEVLTRIFIDGVYSRYFWTDEIILSNLGTNPLMLTIFKLYR